MLKQLGEGKNMVVSGLNGSKKMELIFCGHRLNLGRRLRNCCHLQIDANESLLRESCELRSKEDNSIRP